MNTDQLDRTIRLYAKRFDEVFNSDRLPTKPRLMVCNTDPSDDTGEHLQSTSMTMNITENISTRSNVHPLVHSNVTCTNVIANGFIIVNSYRVLSVVSVDIFVHAFVFSEVEVSICVAFCATFLAILDLRM